MASEKKSEAHQVILSWPFSKPTQWSLGLVAALVIGLSLPTVITWLTLLGQRSLNDNIPQLVTGTFLLFAITHRRPQAIPLQPSRLGFGLLILAGVLYLLGAWLSIKAVIFAGLLAIWALICWTLWGRAVFYRCLPAFVFALFLVPQFPTDLRTAISLPLQLISTQLATGLASLFIPIKTLGNIFYIRGEAFEVTMACSGLNTWVGYLFAGMLGMLMGRFSAGRLARLLVGAPLLALGQNVIRLWITALVAYWISPKTALDIHTNLEYILFPLGLVVMVLANRQIERRLLPQPIPTPENAILHTPAHSGGKGIIWATIGLLMLINIGLWFPQKASKPDAPLLPLPPAPYQVGAWHGENLPFRHDEVAILAPATIISRAYHLGSAQSDQPLIWLNLLEAPSMNALHNVVDSLVASGAKPKLLGTLTLNTRKGPLKASWFRCMDETGKPYNLMLWYQWQGGNAENRWAWYWNVLTLKLQKRQPTWRLVEIATPSSPTDPSPQQTQKLEQLKAFAIALYPTLVP